MAKKATLVCRPCGARVMVSDLGAAVVECYECGVEMVETAKGAGKPAPKKAPARKALPAARKKAARKPAPKKAAAKKK